MLSKDLIERLIGNMREIEKLAAQFKQPSISKEEKERGKEVSFLAMKQQPEVPMSPIMKNLMVKAGDLQTGERLLVNSKPTRAEEWVHSVCEAALQKFNGAKPKGYNFNAPLESILHYNVDCWDNLKDNMRDVQPDQAKQRSEVAAQFSVKPLELDVYKLLSTDVVFQKAVEIVFDLLPKVRASQEFREVNLPFMTKHTNVGYPYFRNDRRPAPFDKNETYAQLTMRISETLPLDQLSRYNVIAYYGRNQRGKGRLICGTSRIINLSLNRLESEEIAAYKSKCSLFAGYNNDEYLQECLTTILDECTKRNLKCANWDQSKYDMHVSPGFILLLGAMSMEKANGKTAFEIAKYRAALMLRSWAINGLDGTIKEVFGRIFSGFIDTNRGGGIINAIISTYCVMKQDPNYSDLVYRLAWYMLVMGDDNLFVYETLDHDQFVKDMESLHFEVNPDKQQYGVFFLQNRIYKANNGDIVMMYPWTRVVKSMLFKEHLQGLGPYGWLASELQQLNKIKQDPVFLGIVVNMLYPYDSLHLGVGITADKLIQGIKSEDQEAKKKDPSSLSTAEKLYDGDPTKASQFKVERGDIQLEPTYFSSILDAVNKVYDPAFFSSLGVKAL